MAVFKLNPVTLITGAAAPLGAACARDIARQSTGGLILIDADEDGLAATADALPWAPERVSTLAFDSADAARWAQATAFITDHYGRVDWAVVNADPAPATASELWQSGKDVQFKPALQSLRAVLPVIGANTDGGAIVVTASATTLHGASGHGPDLLQLVAAVAAEGASANVRINAVAIAGAENDKWRDAPQFHDIVRQTGSDRAALEHIAALKAPLVRYAGGESPARLIVTLLTENPRITGVTLVADAGYAL